MECDILRNYYFKMGENSISGLTPKLLYDSVRFIGCTFHPNVWDTVTFINCRFKNCDVWGSDLDMNPDNKLNRIG